MGDSIGEKPDAAALVPGPVPEVATGIGTIHEFLQLTKPRIALLIVLSWRSGFVLGSVLISACLYCFMPCSEPG